MKKMESDERIWKWNREERFLNAQNLKKRQKTSAKSFVRGDELKRQFTYTLKANKNSNADVSKSKEQEVTMFKSSKAKFLSESDILSNSEYFRMTSVNRASDTFCTAKRGEKQLTISEKISFSCDKATDSRKVEKVDQMEPPSQAEELKNIRNNVDVVMQEMKLLNRDFGLIRTNVKAIEKQIQLQKQNSVEKESQTDTNKIHLNLGQFSKEAKKAAPKLRDFVENNQIPVLDNEDFDRIINSLHGLSEMANQPKIVQTSKGAKFEVPKELPISLYSDGFLLRNKDFSKYSDVRAALFLQDVKDGYFPSELRSEYPNGVPFQVRDRRCEVFKNDESVRFPGKGCRLGSTFDKKMSSTVIQNPASNCNKPEEHCKQSHHKRESGDDEVRLLTLRVRLGIPDEKFFRVEIKANDKMNRFQNILFGNLYERYGNQAVPDFELHVYGRKPFRLSEHLDLSPFECGLVENCVVNLTQIC